MCNLKREYPIELKRNHPILLIILYSAAILLLTILLPKEENWDPDYSSSSEIPFGSMLFFEGLEELFPSSQIFVNHKTMYEGLQEVEPDQTILVLVDERMVMDPLDLSSLFTFIRKGGVVFLAANPLPHTLLDSLEMKERKEFEFIFSTSEETEDTSNIPINFYKPDLKKADNYHLLKEQTISYIEAGDSLSKSIPLSWIKSIDKPNMILTKLGRGMLIIHSTPTLFTNYAMVQESGPDYIAKCFSFLPDRDIIWDEYYKPSVRQNREGVLTVIFQERSLRIAWYITLGGVFLFLVFMSKRKQRIIPVIEPYANDSKNLIATMGSLYYNNADNAKMAVKIKTIIKQYSFKKFNVSLVLLDENEALTLHHKSGIDVKTIRKAFSVFQNNELGLPVTDAELQELDTFAGNLIQEFSYTT